VTSENPITFAPEMDLLRWAAKQFDAWNANGILKSCFPIKLFVGHSRRDVDFFRVAALDFHRLGHDIAATVPTPDWRTHRCSSLVVIPFQLLGHERIGDFEEGKEPRPHPLCGIQDDSRVLNPTGRVITLKTGMRC
jgi:hypothetical protein